MQDRASDTREKLLKAAAEVIDTKSYDRASLNDILRLAGVTKGALYHHFASKAVMAQALVEEQFAPELSGPRFAGRPILHAAEVAVSAATALTTDQSFRAAFGLVVDSPRDDLGDLSGAIRQWTNLIAGLIEEDVNCADPVDPFAESQLAVTYFVGAYTVARAQGDFAAILPSLTRYWRAAVVRIVVEDMQGEYLVNLSELFDLAE